VSKHARLRWQAFCINKTVSRIPRSTFASHVQPACERIMLGAPPSPLWLGLHSPIYCFGWVYRPSLHERSFGLLNHLALTRRTGHTSQPAHKREIVGKFLGTELSGRTLPDKKDAICADMVHACPRHDERQLSSACDFCQVRTAPPRVIASARTSGAERAMPTHTAPHPTGGAGKCVGLHARL